MASEKDGNKIFLTREEAERIRTTVQNRLKMCSEVVGHARQSRDAKAAISQATGAALLADMGSGPADADMTRAKSQGAMLPLPVLAVGEPYPPCIVSLKDLQPIKLSDLRMETHHRGCKLTVKRASPVVTLAAKSWTMVQDQGVDETERLEVYLHNFRHGEDVVESGVVFVIKEPYFTLTDRGEATIRIDHPSDLIVFRNEIFDSNIDSPSEVRVNAESAEELDRIATKFKNEGNSALKQYNLPVAHAKYTEGLKLARKEVLYSTNPDLARDISRNRAHVNLLLNQLDEAKADATASLTGREDQRSKDLDSKAYFRAGCAAYNLGKYQEARGFFDKQQKLTPDEKETNTYMRRIEMRLYEKEMGRYNFKKIKAGLSRARSRVDAASFIGNTMIGESPGKGFGVFATSDIPSNEMFICEKAFCVVWDHERDALMAMTYDVRDDKIRVSPAGLCRSTVQKLLNNPSQIERVLDLYGDYHGVGKNIFKTDEGPIIDTFRIHDIIARNAFGPGSQYGDEGARDASAGLWVWAAHMNHSCVPNASREYIGDLMVLHATRPIRAGEEIFLSYDDNSDYDARQAALMNTWGFECTCALCVAEKADDSAVRERRRELASTAEAFTARTRWADAERLEIAKARRLKKAIDNTYDVERYKDVPRMATRRIEGWLGLACKSTHRRARS